jgi:hypothetical protein
MAVRAVSRRENGISGVDPYWSQLEGDLQALTVVRLHKQPQVSKSQKTNTGTTAAPSSQICAELQVTSSIHKGIPLRNNSASTFTIAWQCVLQMELALSCMQCLQMLPPLNWRSLIEAGAVD